MKRIFLLIAVMSFGATSCLGDRPDFKDRPIVTPPIPTENFVSGADISAVTEFEAKGVKFYNKEGQERECTALMKELGMNAIRLRVFVNPKDGMSSKEDVLLKALRVKEHGMRLMIDFHYSDGFADPGKQNIPAEWVDFDLNQMKEAVYNHTKDVLSTLKDNNIDVEWVQVGNETTGGMLWPVGNASTSMGAYSVLTHQGYKAVKDVYPDAQVIVHIDRAQLLDIYTFIFNGLQINKCPWDIIGMSFYPDANLWQKQTDVVVENIIKLSEKYGTPCMMVETGMHRNDSANAKKFFTYLFDKMMNHTKGYCRGIMYWEPETYRESGYDKGAFSDEGRPTEALEPFDLRQY